MRNESQNTTRNGGGFCDNLHVQLASNKQVTALEHFARCLKIEGESPLASLLFTLTSWLYQKLPV
jgi:hypothetical protein